jgi:hypothetical protein
VTVCHHVMSRVTVMYSSSAHLCLLYFFNIHSLLCSTPCWYTLLTFLLSSTVSSTSVWFLRKYRKKEDWSIIVVL